MRTIAKPFPEILSASQAEILDRLEWLADLMDSRFRIPGTKIRFGIDPLLGLVPVAGDAIAAVVSIYILLELADLGVPAWTRLRMLWNILLDFAVGSVPVLGDAVDVGFKSNKRNLALARRALQKKAARRKR